MYFVGGEGQGGRCGGVEGHGGGGAGVRVLGKWWDRCGQEYYYFLFADDCGFNNTKSFL